MSAATTPTGPLVSVSDAPDDATAGMSEYERIAAEDARRDMLRAQVSPLDRALMRPNARPHSAALDAFDAPDTMHVPNQAWDPRQVETLEDFEELQGYGCTQAVEALRGLHKFVSDVIAYRERVKADLTLTGPAKALAVADLFDRHMATATRRIDTARDTLARALAHEQAQLNQPLADTSKYAGEVRSHFKAMQPGERIKAMADAVAAGDVTTLGAVLGGAPLYLSGLSIEQAASFRQQANLKRNPQGAKKVALLSAAHDKLVHAGSIFVGSIDRITGVDHRTVAALRSKRATAPTMA